MDVSKTLSELKKLGTAQTRKTYARHGAPDAMFGVKVGDLKPLAKRLKGDQEAALALYESGNSDAMYLAGMIADGSQMTKKQLDAWAKGASWYMISEYTVPGVAAESQHGRDMALKWIKSRKEGIASAGWATYAGLLSVLPDDELDFNEIRGLLDDISKCIHDAPNRVRYTMNGFVIAVGTYVKPLLAHAKKVAEKIGTVSVEMGQTACKVPFAPDYIAKVEKMGRVGKKRKTAKCS